MGARGASPGRSPTAVPGVRSDNPTLRQRLRYRFVGGSANGAVVMNPSKSEEIVLSVSDRIVVLAED